MRITLDGVEFGEMASRAAAFQAANELNCKEMEMSYFHPIVSKETTEQYQRIGRQWTAVDERGFIAVVGSGKRAGYLKRDHSNKLIILER